MKLFKKMRKGFTLIELVVVIAVIAILSAVSIVSYVAITNRAKQSNDQQKVNQVNLSLAAGEISKKPETMYDALQVVKEDGFGPEKFKTESKDYTFAYKMSVNKFVILEKGKVVYPEGVTTGDKTDLWLFSDAGGDLKDGYSHYLRSEVTEAVEVSGGLDVGENKGVPSILYSNSGEKQTAVIRTDGGTLTINAPKDTVKHYGDGIVLDIKAVDSASYHEYGYFPKAKIAQGRVVVENAGEIPSFEISAVPTSTNPIKIETAKDVVVSASAEVVTQLGDNKLDNVNVKVTSSSANVVVDEKVNSSNVQAEGKTAADLVTITKVKNLAELKEALLNVNAKYIQVTQDITSVSELIKINRSVVLDGDGHTISGNGGLRASNRRLIVVNFNGSANVAPATGTSDVEIKNANLMIGSETAGVENAGVIETRGYVNSFKLENVNAFAYASSGYCQPLTLGGNQFEVTLNATIRKSHLYGNDHYAIIIWNRVNLNVEDSVLEAWAGLYFKAASNSNGTYGSVVKVTGSSFICPNYHSGKSNSFGAIVFEDGGIRLDLENCMFDVTSYGDQTQSAILFSGYWAAQTGGNLVNNQIRMKNVDIKGTINDTEVQYDNSNGIIIDSGRTTVDPSLYVSDQSVVINEGLFYLIKGRE